MSLARGIVAMMVAALGACGTDPPSWQPDAGGCVGYIVPSTTDLSMPVISFKADVMKVLNGSCGSSMCHGTHSGPTGGLFLGAATATGSDADLAYAALVGPMSSEHTGMRLVAPGDTARSFLMHKLDGDQCLFAAQCGGGDCLRSMPQGLGVLLAVPTRDVIRKWITQGAANN